MKAITKIEPSEVREISGKRRVAAYCRVSTDMEDQLVSLDTQKSHYEEYISANPDWKFAGLYYDEGITGTKKELRPALMQMIRDCEDGKIDYIVTKSLSRFARNTADCLELVRKLLAMDIPVYFEKENLDTGSIESELLLSIMSSLAESESVSISENEKWSIRDRFENGTFKLGYVPYGYHTSDGIISIVEEEAKWVRYLFEGTLSGKSSHQLARELNEKQIPTRRHGHWTASTVRGILRNEKYTGDCLFQKTFTDFQFKRHNNKGEMDQFFMEGHHEPIVSRDDFEAVAKMIERHAKEKNIVKADPKYQNRYPFSGKITCGECGSSFKRRMNNTGNIKYASWVCQEHITDITHCGMKAVREDALERTFTMMMNKLIYGRKPVLNDLLENLKGESHDDALREMKAIDRQLERNTERKQTLRDIMAKGYLEPAVFAKENSGIGAENEALAAKKEQLIKSMNGSARHIAEIVELLHYTCKAQMTDGFDGQLVEHFLERITVHSDEELTFHLKCGLNLRERILK